MNTILIPYKGHSGGTYYGFDFTFSSDHTNPRIMELLFWTTFNAPESGSVNIAKKNMTLRSRSHYQGETKNTQQSPAILDLCLR